MINPAFSVLQKDKKARSKPDWPEWPITLEKAVDPGKEKGLNKSPLPPEKQQPEPADASITDDVPEETSDQNVFYNTFHRRNSPEEARVVFNPFKKIKHRPN
ncbi:hypothetical protein QS257_14945 [Terrilactibacillus sp. S3-3]|nr:hypothetical protein QS257_14945 [Terrilactibacillus sp. S3-3]